jgi:hypothetical protein
MARILHSSKQLADAKTALATVVDDMGFLRNQITTTEVTQRFGSVEHLFAPTDHATRPLCHLLSQVNMARVFNWDVKSRRVKKTDETVEAS